MANKREIINDIAARTDLSKHDAELVLDALTASITDHLAKGDSVQIIGFGTFETRQRAARNGRNPATGEAMEIPATTTPAFKAGKELKTIVKQS